MNDAISILDDPRVDLSTWAYRNLTRTDIEHSQRVKPRTVAGSTNVNPLDELTLVTATATLTLETPVGCDGRKHTFALTAAATMTIASSANIDGAASIATSTQYDVIAVESTGVTWKLLYKTVAAVASGMTLLSTVTASASATVDLETTIDGTYERYIVEATDVVFAADGQLRLRFKTAGAYDTGSSYQFNGMYWAQGDLLPSPDAGSATYMQIGGAALESTDSIDFTANFGNLAGTALKKKVMFTVAGLNVAGNPQFSTGSGFYTPTTAVTGIRFYNSAGNITSGKFRLYGIAKA